mmetsp:Transcript_177/g.599  ORF Transcript_177/g.599 Transcript_177/m.599 type:complete len:345 (+) Transcript_177:94-1128(+)
MWGSRSAASGGSSASAAQKEEDKPAGPVVTRRVGANMLGPGGVQRAESNRMKPSVRQTIESMVSTGSQSEYFQPSQTIILFDWDDTLCPSNWIRENRPALSFFKPAPNEEKYQRPLRELQIHVEACLKLALKMGKVIIVTNAMEPWVETSCRNFLPTLMPIVSGIPVIYARSIYDQLGADPARSRAAAAARGSTARSGAGAALPGMFGANGQNKLASFNGQLRAQTEELAPQKWKELAFEQEITGFYSRYQHQSWKNVISIGDSIFERDAVRRVVCNRPQNQKKCRTKTAKLLDEPEIDELISQVKVIHDALGLMVQYDGNLDIEIDEEDLKLDLSLVEKIMDR